MQVIAAVGLFARSCLRSGGRGMAAMQCIKVRLCMHKPVMHARFEDLDGAWPWGNRFRQCI